MADYSSGESLSRDQFERLLRDAPEREQPLARLERLGPSALSIPELLQLLLDSRSDPLLPLHLVTTWTTLNEMANASPLDLLREDGMTRLRSARIRAALELGKRALCERAEEKPIIRSPQDVANLLLPEMSGLPQEQMRVVNLNTKNRVLAITTVYQGSLHTTVLRIADIFREAVRHNSAAIVVAHNHPSGGMPMPSPEDIAVTRELVKAGNLLDIPLMDHMIVGSGGQFVSLKDRGLGAL
jgi:DNA repair protein RadC